MANQFEQDGTFVDEEDDRSSVLVWDALQCAKKEFQPWWHVCDRIDRIIDATRDTYGSIDNSTIGDQEFDLYWSSLEIIKPAVYSRPPQPVVSPRFPDRNKTAIKASELLERCLVSSFDRGDFDQVMLGVRDDLCINGRGATRVYYESDERNGKSVCDEHLDRTDFLHEPARKWSEVGWVAFAAYLDRRQFKDRFGEKSLDQAQFNVRRDEADGVRVDTAAKCKVWEVWHKADNRVYWVTEGVDTFLDESEPFLDLEGFFPCPRPAYGTLKRRQLIPVPDYTRYEITLNQINELTRRIHSLLGWIKVKGLIPAGGDVSAAVETALSATSGDDVLLIPVPQAALVQGGSGQFVQFLPLQEFAAAITGLLDARRELIQNFYELSGISDIMRGATDAGETLGAQQLKSQFGSVRVREKIDELQRVARDMARITAEVIAEKFTADDIQRMAQMTLPKRADLKKQLKDLEDAAERDMQDLEEKAMLAAEQARMQQDPEASAQVQQQFEQAQQQIIEQYQPKIQDISAQVPIEDVMDLLRDQKARAFAIDIETDSTIMVDEMAEKQSRSEFLTAFSNASAAVQPLLMAGEAGAALAGAMLKFSLAPYRAGRELDGMIDEFVDVAPQTMQQEGDDGADELQRAMAEANQKLAEAELQKAQAAVAKVQADTAKATQETQLKAQEAAVKAQQDQERFLLEVEQTKGSLAETDARIEKIVADIQLAFAKLGIEQHKEERETVKDQVQFANEQHRMGMEMQDRERDAAFRAQDAQRADRQQEFTERNTDRQQTFAERQADKPQGEGS